MHGELICHWKSVGLCWFVLKENSTERLNLSMNLHISANESVSVLG